MRQKLRTGGDGGRRRPARPASRSRASPPAARSRAPPAPRRTARRGACSLAASALQGALFGSVLFASAHLAAREPPPLPVVEIQIVRSAPRRAYAPPAAPAVLSSARRLALAARPGVRTYEAPPPSALVQPRLVPDEMRLPASDEPIEELDPAALAGDGDGVVGASRAWCRPPSTRGRPPPRAAGSRRRRGG